MKKYVSLLLALALLLTLLPGCGNGAEEVTVSEQPGQPAQAGPTPLKLSNPDGGTWTVLVYLCGTDLETNGSYASINVAEMASATQSDHINVLFQTGGTQQWAFDTIDPGSMQRWKVGYDSFELVDEQPLASMGEAQTLGEFLRWGVEAYPADKYMCILWDHGGGSVAGIVSDELHGGDGLDLKELAQGISMAGVQFEVAGFDACLMSTLETAAALAPYARYMLASQEWEPGTGWDYTAWLTALAEDPAMDGLAIGRVICDSFYEKCTLIGAESLSTLAVTDLSQVPALVAAFDTMAAEMKGLTDSPASVRPLTQAITKAENYGGNNANEGYTNMVDLGDLALCAEGVLSKTGEAVLDSLFAAVPYHVAGAGRQRSNGLSVFVPLEVRPKELDAYAYTAAISGEYLRFMEGMYGWTVPKGVVVNQPVLPEAAEEPPVKAGVEVDKITLAQALNAQDYNLAYTTEITEDGYLLLTVDEGAEIVSIVAYNLFYLDEESNTINFLGTDFDVNSNEEGTAFWDNFRNVWPVVNGNTCSMLALSFTEDYILYTIPVMVNGHETNLRMLYHIDAAEYEIVGTWDGIDDDTGMSSREAKELADGDVVEFLFGAADLDGGGDGFTFAYGGFTVDGDILVEEATLFDGVFYYQYEITDIFGNVYESEFAILTSENGEITIEPLEE